MSHLKFEIPLSMQLLTQHVFLILQCLMSFYSFLFENRCFSLKEAGTINCDPFDINRSLMLKPLLAIKSP